METGCVDPIDGKYVYIRVIVRPAYPAALHFRNCVLSHEGGRSTRWKEQDNALHAWTPLCSKYRAPKSANNDGIGGKKNGNNDVALSIYDAIDLSRRLRKLTAPYTPSFLQSKKGERGRGNTKFHHDPQTGRLDAPRDSLRELPAAKNRYHSYVGAIMPLFAVPTPAHARPRVHTRIFRRSFALSPAPYLSR